MSQKLPRLYLVTNAEIVARDDFPRLAAAALKAAGPGCALQLRAPGAAGRPLFELAASLMRVAVEAAAELWVNDRLDVAAAVRAHGVQLGSGSLAPAEARRVLGLSCRIGVSLHSVEESLGAGVAGSDLVVLGNIYDTPSHPGREPIGLDAIRRASAGRPIVAIGGITPGRIAEVIRAGAWGIAVLSGVWQAPDVTGAVQTYIRELRSAIADAAGNTG